MDSLQAFVHGFWLPIAVPIEPVPSNSRTRLGKERNTESSEFLSQLAMISGSTEKGRTRRRIAHIQVAHDGFVCGNAQVILMFFCSDSQFLSSWSFLGDGFRIFGITGIFRD